MSSSFDYRTLISDASFYQLLYLIPLLIYLNIFYLNDINLYTFVAYHVKVSYGHVMYDIPI